MAEWLPRLRRGGQRPPLRRAALGDDPLAAYAAWLAAAIDDGEADAEMAVLATASPQAVPSARAVLVKRVDSRGVVFFTSYESRKGRELAANPVAALCVVWSRRYRQIRLEGPVSLLPADESDDYWATRPLSSRWSATASPQSRVVPDRRALERRVAETARRHPEGPPRPPSWGGFLLDPRAVEFWQGRDDRLHDRFRFERRDDGWRVDRLAP